jgi:hypothetical protein
MRSHSRQQFWRVISPEYFGLPLGCSFSIVFESCLWSLITHESVKLEWGLRGRWFESSRLDSLIEYVDRAFRSRLRGTQENSATNPTPAHSRGRAPVPSMTVQPV